MAGCPGRGQVARPWAAGERRASARAAAAAVAGGTGRWSLLPWAEPDAAAGAGDVAAGLRVPAAGHDPGAGSGGTATSAHDWAAAWAGLLLDRWGVVAREMAVAEPAAPPSGELLPVYTGRPGWWARR